MNELAEVPLQPSHTSISPVNGYVLARENLIVVTEAVAQ